MGGWHACGCHVRGTGGRGVVAFWSGLIEKGMVILELS